MSNGLLQREDPVHEGLQSTREGGRKQKKRVEAAHVWYFSGNKFIVDYGFSCCF